MLIVSKTMQLYEMEEIKCGMLMYAKHRTWEKGERGFITYADEELIIVQYYPGIGNVTNHLKLYAKEVVAGEWEVRWSDDLSDIHKYPEVEVNP